MFTKSSNTDDSLDDLPSDLQKVLEQEIRQDSNKFELDKYSRIVNDKLNQLPPQFTNEQEFWILKIIKFKTIISTNKLC